MKGRTILIEINIDGPKWADFEEESRFVLDHISSNVRMWQVNGWAPMTLLGTDHVPTGMMRLVFDYKIEGLPERSEIEAAVQRAVEESLSKFASAPQPLLPSRRRRLRPDRSEVVVAAPVSQAGSGRASVTMLPSPLLPREREPDKPHQPQPAAKADRGEAKRKPKRNTTTKGARR